MRLFIFLFLTVTSLSVAEAQSTSCPRLAEDAMIYKASMSCSSYGPQISIEYVGRHYFNAARDDHEVLLLLLRVQRTERDKYTPDEIRDLTEYLVSNIRRQLWDDFKFWGRMLPEESVQKMLETYREFDERFVDMEIIDDKVVFSLSNFSQSKLDELHDWLVSNKVGHFEGANPLASDCPITGDLSPILESTQECAVWNSVE